MKPVGLYADDVHQKYISLYDINEFSLFQIFVRRVLVGLFTRCRRFQRDVCLRGTLGCHAPFLASRAVKKTKKPTSPASHPLSTPTPSSTTVYPPIYPPRASIFHSQYRLPPPTLDSPPTNKAPPALINHFLQERHPATFACLHTRPHAFDTTYTSSQWLPQTIPPLPPQCKARSPQLPPTAMSSNGTSTPPHRITIADQAAHTPLSQPPI